MNSEKESSSTAFSFPFAVEVDCARGTGEVEKGKFEVVGSSCLIGGVLLANGA
jgi:hypothetical protein